MRLFQGLNVEPNIVQTVDDVATALAFVSSGLGLRTTNVNVALDPIGHSEEGAKFRPAAVKMLLQSIL